MNNKGNESHLYIDMMSISLFLFAVPQILICRDNTSPNSSNIAQ